MQKIKKHHYDFISRQNGTGHAENDTKKKKKVIVSIHSNLAQNKEFQNDRKEMQKIKKHHYGFISGQNGTRHTGNDENDMGQDENDTKKMLWF